MRPRRAGGGCRDREPFGALKRCLSKEERWLDATGLPRPMSRCMPISRVDRYRGHSHDNMIRDGGTEVLSNGYRCPEPGASRGIGATARFRCRRGTRPRSWTSAIRFAPAELARAPRNPARTQGLLCGASSSARRELRCLRWIGDGHDPPLCRHQCLSTKRDHVTGVDGRRTRAELIVRSAIATCCGAHRSHAVIWRCRHLRLGPRTGQV